MERPLFGSTCCRQSSGSGCFAKADPRGAEEQEALE